MIPPEIEITALTRHPDWPKFAAIFHALEKSELSKLRSSMDPVANRNLIHLIAIRSEITKRSENKDLWNV